MSRTASFAIAVAIAVYSGWIAARAEAVSSSFRPDIDQLWFAARAVLAGRNPYNLVGPGLEFSYDWSLLYPMPAVIFSVPLALFEIETARVAMASLSSAILAYAIARADPRGLVIFASRAFYANAWYAQWTPLLMLMWWTPALWFLVLCKPTVGIAMLAGPVATSKALRWSVVIGAALVALSFAAQPTWLFDWLSAIRSADHIRPWVSLPFGWMLLLAALRWNTWQGRFLLAFSILPQTTHDLAVLPLLLLPPTLIGRAVATALTYVPPLLLVREPFISRLAEAGSHADRFQIRGEVLLWVVLVPVLLMVLFMKPDVVTAGDATGETEKRV